MKFIGRLSICLFVLSLLIQNQFSNAYGFWGGHKFKDEIRDAYIDKNIEIIPQQNKIRMGYGTFSLGDFHYVKTLDQIFFVDDLIKAEIKEIDFEDETITVELFNLKYGFGKITFFFGQNAYEKTDAGIFKEVLDSSLSRASLSKVVVNRETRAYHLPSCNHLPPIADSEIVNLDQAKQTGIKPCGFCFKHFIYLPDYTLEEQIARKMAASLRYFSPIIDNDDEQMSLSRAGQKVLSSWPVDLLGYDYRFTLIDSKAINAFSLPGGEIFVTTGLFRSLEDPLELEAVLAHEIAHIERRHTLKSFKHQQQTQQAHAAMAAFAGAAAGMAVSNGDYGTANSALAISVTMMALTELTSRGYSKDHEQEADIFSNLYFDYNDLNKKWLTNVFQKLQFVNLCIFADPDPDSHTHPQLRERVDSIGKVTFHNFKEEMLFCTKRNYERMYIKPILNASIESKNIIYIFIDNDDFVSEKMNDFDVKDLYLSVESQNKLHQFTYKKRDTVFTEFGAILTFVNKSEVQIDNIDNANMVIELGQTGTREIFKDSYKFRKISPNSVTN